MNGEESYAERLARQAREFVDAAGTKGGRFARIGRLQLDLLGIRRELQQEMRRLGERTLELIRRGEVARIAEDPIAGPILRRIEQIEHDRTQREAEIERARTPPPARETSP